MARASSSRAPKSASEAVDDEMSDGEDDKLSDTETKATELAQDMARNAKNRREKRRANIRNQHAQALERLREDMESNLDKIADRVSKDRRHRLRTLVSLIQKRSAIESSLMASSKTIDDACLRAHIALTSALRSRQNDVKTVRKELAKWVQFIDHVEHTSLKAIL